MFIQNISLIKYIIDGKYTVVKQSNSVETKIVLPIIKFIKFNCKNYVKVYIKNSSMQSIYNLIYFDFKAGIVDVYINGYLVRGINLSKGFFLGRLLENQSIVLKYIPKKTSINGMISYKIYINNNINHIFLLSRNM